MNLVVLRGRVLRQPVTRETTVSTVVDIELEVSYLDGPKEAVAVVWLPDHTTTTPDAGDELVVLGRVRRRFFRTGNGQTATKTEVVAERIVSPRNENALCRLFVEAHTRLGQGEYADA